eukprot:scaffold34432_cov90-Isochrysis_galbana.AAC.2
MAYSASGSIFDRADTTTPKAPRPSTRPGVKSRSNRGTALDGLAGATTVGGAEGREGAPAVRRGMPAALPCRHARYSARSAMS